MNQKSLNRFIVALSACLISVAFTLINVTMISKEQVLLSLFINLLSVISDAVIMIALYHAIGSIFPHKTVASVLTSAMSVLFILPLWFGFKRFVFEGDFNLGVIMNTLYVLYINNFIIKIMNGITTYFGVTLFTAPDVVTQFFTFILKLMTDTINYVLVPIMPIILIIRDAIVGNEEYQFNNEVTEKEHDPLI